MFHNRLESLATNSDYLIAVSIAASSFHSGWGKVSPFAFFNSLALREAQVPLIAWNECRRYYPLLKRQHLCAGTKNRGACTGDGGAGLYCLSRLSKHGQQQQRKWKSADVPSDYVEISTLAYSPPDSVLVNLTFQQNYSTPWQNYSSFSTSEMSPSPLSTSSAYAEELTSRPTVTNFTTSANVSKQSTVSMSGTSISTSTTETTQNAEADERWFVYGVASSYNRCGLLYDTFQRVSSFSEWIRQTVSRTSQS